MALNGNLNRLTSLSGSISRAGGGTSDYEKLKNKPQINGTTLTGNKTAADLGLADASAIPTKVSDLTNDSAFVNASGAAAAAPVQSVNGQTGDVTIQAATDAQVTTAVNTWLGNNVAQETGYVLDSSLTMSNAAAPADKVGDLKSAIENLEAIPYSVKMAMDTLFSKAIYTDDVASSYAIFHVWATATPVTSITAVFTQGSAIIYDTDSLDTLRQYLTVTATYADSTTATVTDYTLSGTLTEGTCTITVSYGGKTSNFAVVVSHAIAPLLNGVYTDNKGCWRIEVTNGRHVKAIVTNAEKYSFAAMDMNRGEVGSDSTITINKSLLFTLPANVEARLDTNNFVMSNTDNPISYVIALRYTTGTTSILNSDYQTTAVHLTATPEADVPIGCLFIYFDKNNTYSVGDYIEFDVSVTADGNVYV